MRIAIASLLTTLAVAGAIPAANADPADLVPYCSGDQTPMDSNCRTAPSQIATHEGSGLSPNLPSGLNPGEEPVI